VLHLFEQIKNKIEMLSKIVLVLGGDIIEQMSGSVHFRERL
jgi:hypothetical protein